MICIYILSTYDYDFPYASLPVIHPQLGCLVSPMMEWYLQLDDSSTTWVAYFFRRHLTSMWQIFMRLGHSNFWKDRDVLWGKPVVANEINTPGWKQGHFFRNGKKQKHKLISANWFQVVRNIYSRVLVTTLGFLVRYSTIWFPRMVLLVASLSVAVFSWNFM